MTTAAPSTTRGEGGLVAERADDERAQRAGRRVRRRVEEPEPEAEREPGQRRACGRAARRRARRRRRSHGAGFLVREPGDGRSAYHAAAATAPSSQLSPGEARRSCLIADRSRSQRPRGERCPSPSGACAPSSTPAASASSPTRRGRHSREIVELALTGLACVRHRQAIAADGLSGDGAGILVPIPRDVLRPRRRQGARARARRRPARRRVGVPRPRATTPPSAPRRRRWPRPAPPKGIELAGWRAVPDRRDAPRRGQARADLPVALARHPAATRRTSTTSRPSAARTAPAGGRRPRCREAQRAPLLRQLVVRDRQLQGARDQRPARRRSIPTSQTDDFGAPFVDLPQPLLDEHHAGVGARPALPQPVPQRRDQHRAGATSIA